MRIFWAAAVAAMLACGTARAEGQPPAQGDPAVGVGIICNTPEEAKKFVDLRSRGAAAEQAMQAVNTDAGDERACGVAAIAYVLDATIDTTTIKDRLVQIVRINVIAGFNGAAWQRVTDMVQYAVIEGEGEAV